MNYSTLSEKSIKSKNLIRHELIDRGFTEEIAFLMKVYENCDDFSMLIANDGSIEKESLINNLRVCGIPNDKIEFVLKIWREFIISMDDFPEDISLAQNTIEEKKENLIIPVPQITTLQPMEYSVINPHYVGSEEFIYIPCGIETTDLGFQIYGIKKENMCSHPLSNIYALVYNVLIKSTCIKKDDLFIILEKFKNNVEIDYKSVYRIAIIILQLIKNNIIVGNIVSIKYVDNEAAELAVALINFYAGIFARLSKEKKYRDLKYENKGISISLAGMEIKGIYIKNNEIRNSSAREFWYGRKIIYELDENNLNDMKLLLNTIFRLENFKDAQYETLCNMLSCREDSICILPTGSGKSLIYYFMSFLQPLPVIIISPTDVLIDDQIRNLKDKHHIDNVAHLMMKENTDFTDYDICTNMNFITPTTFQDRGLLQMCRRISQGIIKVCNNNLKVYCDEVVCNGPRIAYTILDEIHCLSNWGHDFRPEYLMLSKNLNDMLPGITKVGFTATANYTVVKDIELQLKIKQQNFISLKEFERFNVSYYFIECDDENQMYEKMKHISQSIINTNRRTIIFTKNDEISTRIADVIGYKARVFLHGDSTQVIKSFVQNKFQILVASEDLGVGIDLPNIENIVHFGLPFSKCEYVQEIGRARDSKSGSLIKSYVLFLKEDEKNNPKNLLNRRMDFGAISKVINDIKYNNDFSDIYRMVTNNCPTQKELLNKLLQFKQDIIDEDKPFVIRTYEEEKINVARQRLYMLFVIGFLKDWYTYKYNEKNNGIDILISRCNGNWENFKRDVRSQIKKMADSLTEYIESMDNDEEACSRVSRANSEDEILEIYVDWFYRRYLYFHNEEFINVYDFIKSNMKSDSAVISEELASYFVLPFVKMRKDENRFSKFTVDEAIEKGLSGIKKESFENLTQILSSKYYLNIDILVFFSEYRYRGRFDEDRLNRILSQSGQCKKILDAIPKMYGHTQDIQARLDLLNYIKKNYKDEEFEKILKDIFQIYDKDLIYYGILSINCNGRFIKKED